MAGPQFFTPPQVKPSLPKKRFTLAEANKSLPYVRRVVQDLVSTHQAAVTFQQRIEKLGEKPSQAKQRSVADRELAAVKSRLQDLVDELAVVGAELKDAKTGLIDFVGRHKGHDVYLCWRLGETDVRFFHELDTGFAGRQPIAMLREGD